VVPIGAVEAPADDDPVVTRGSVLSYRTFDVADSIRLNEAEHLLLEARVDRSSLTFKQPPLRELGTLKASAAPLRIDLGAGEVELGGKKRYVHRSIQFFDYGTISVVFELPIRKPAPLSEVSRLCIELHGAELLTQDAREQYANFEDKMQSAFSGVHTGGELLSYGLVLVQSLEGSTARSLLDWNGLSKLLAGEPDTRPASSFQTKAVLDYADAYLDDDLVVIGTAAALIVEPSGSRDVADVIEVARAQAAQLRYSDEQLDRELTHACRDFEQHRAILAVWSPHGPAVRRVSRRMIELTEFTERIDNALRVVADEYLSRVYRKAVHRFAIPMLKERIAHKQQVVSEIYSVLRDEVQMIRSFALEIAILLLIVTEVALALLGH
jgi:hypothetical protein